MNKLFEILNKWLSKNKKVTMLLFALVLSIVGLLASKLQFEEDITRLIPVSHKSDVLSKVLQQVNFADKIIVYFETEENGTINDLTACASEFLDSIDSCCNNYIKEVQGRVADEDLGQTLDFVYNNIPLFLDANDYKILSGKLLKDSIAKITEANYKTLISPTGAFARRTIQRDPLGLSFLGLRKLQKLQLNEDFKIQDNFLVTSDNKNLLLFLKPALASNETDGNTKFVNSLYQVQQKLNNKYKGKVSSEYYGATVVAVANASQIKRDIQFTVGIAVTVLLLILIFFYRKVSVPFVLFLPTIFGALFAVAFLYILKGKISAISLGIGSVLLGITLDYSLHVLTHLRSNQNLKQLYKDITRPVLMSSMTTAVAFICLLFLKSEALQDLGIFAAVSVFTASITALVLIPLIYGSDKKTDYSKDSLIDKISAYNYHRSPIFIGLIIVAFIISLFSYKKVYFDNDISKMNYQTPDLLKTEQKLDKLTNTNAKSIYVTAYGNDLETALKASDTIAQILESLKDNSRILSFSTIGSLVQSQREQQDKIDSWNDFWRQHKVDSLQKQLIISGEEFGLKPHTFNAFYQHLHDNFHTVNLGDFETVRTFFTDEFISSNNNFTTVTSMLKVSDDNYQNVVNQLSTSKDTVVIDRKQMNEAFLGNLKADFNKLIGYSLLAVIIILLLSFRNIELTLVTIIPIALTWFITIGVMGLLNVKFNIFNIIISTFIFGLGVDYSIFVTNGLIKQYALGTKDFKTYKTSILLSVITTILGIGVMILAKHPALKSISTVSVIGIVTAMLMAYTFQPLLFRLAVTLRTKKGLAPLRLRTFIHSVLLTSFYTFGGMILSLLSITILPLIPLSKKIKMRWLHGTMARMVTAILYGNPFVKKKVINEYNETFQKPAIIIANHASSLDTLTIGMVTHNVIYLVNDWVYKSPIFGLLARVTGFYPVSNGVNESLDHLKEKVRQGYCLVVFPEARRSFTNKVGRFHKGAFYLSNALQLDILPLYLHGNADVMPKGDVVIYDGSLTVVVGKRIDCKEQQTFGSNDRDRMKNIGAFYKLQYQKLRETLEGPEYFSKKLLSNYSYKPQEYLDKVRDDFDQHKEQYKTLNAILPSQTNIAHISEDYGQIDILLSLRCLNKNISTYNINKESRLIASNCYTIQHRKVSYFDHVDKIFSNTTEILLLSATIDDVNLIPQETILKNINFIVLLGNEKYIDHFKTIGFKVTNRNGIITSLKKYIGEKEI